jgi:phosphoesterase RecJ-like protein
MQGIYLAILTDTGGFRFSNSTPASHRIAAEIIEGGVDPEEMHGLVYGAAPLRRYRLLQQALATLEVDEVSGVAWMTIPKDALLALGATPEDLEGMVDVPRGIQGTQVGLLFRETSSGEVKVSFRSNGGVDVNELARRFGGGGHVRASGAIIPGPVERAVPEVVAAAKLAVDREILKGARV